MSSTLRTSSEELKKGRNDRYLVPAVEQASRVLFCLAQSSSSYMSLIEICAKVGIHKSKAFSILETLQRFGLVRRNGDGRGYALGPGLVTLSRKVLDDMSVAHLAEPIIEALAKKTGCTAVLGLVTGNSVFIAAKHEGEGDIGVTMRIGRNLPLTYGAHGKAVTAFLPESDRTKLLQDKHLYFHGKAQQLDKARLERELAKCRRVGYAEDLGEINRGLNVVAAPVIDHDGIPIGFLEIFFFLPPESARDMGPSVAEASRSLSRLLGADRQ